MAAAVRGDLKILDLQLCHGGGEHSVILSDGDGEEASGRLCVRFERLQQRPDKRAVRDRGRGISHDDGIIVLAGLGAGSWLEAVIRARWPDDDGHSAIAAPELAAKHLHITSADREDLMRSQIAVELHHDRAGGRECLRRAAKRKAPGNQAGRLPWQRVAL